MAQASSPVTVQRREKDGTRRNVECPPLLPDYQSFMRGIDRGDQLMGYYNVGRRSFMRGIDRGDQLMGYYNVGRRSKKWWKRVFAYLLEVSVECVYFAKVQ